MQCFKQQPLLTVRQARGQQGQPGPGVADLDRAPSCARGQLVGQLGLAGGGWSQTVIDKLAIGQTKSQGQPNSGYRESPAGGQCGDEGQGVCPLKTL